MPRLKGPGKGSANAAGVARQDELVREAVLSDCGRYRWTLGRRWDDQPLLVVAMFNPSDADAHRDDPTVTLLCHIARHNGFGGISVVNLCPLRTSKPAAAIEMLQGAQCIPGTDLAAREILWRNFGFVHEELRRAGGILLAWGAMGGHAGDWYRTFMMEVRDRRETTPVFRLGTCANGHPKHPMARGRHKVPRDAPLLRWEIGHG